MGAYLSHACATKISVAISKNILYKGFLWKRKISNSAESLPEEEWRLLSDYPGYEVSSHGRVKHTKKNTLLVAHPLNGYFVFNLRVSRKVKRESGHRLVAKEFCAKGHGKHFVDHIDGDPQNNHHANLRWVDRSENQRNPITIQRRSKEVYQFSKSGVFTAQFSSGSEAAKSTGLLHSRISLCCTDKAKSHGGFLWRFS